MNARNLVAAAALALSAAGLAHAGYVSHPTVSITTYSSGVTVTTGSYAGARNSADNLQYIFCQTNGDSSYICAAQTASGQSVWCISDFGPPPSIMDDVRALGPGSYLSFRSTGATCTSMWQVKASYYQ